MKTIAWIALAVLIATGSAAAKRPQILPEPMLVNLFALSEASAAMKICEDSAAYAGLPAGKKALLRRLQGVIDGLVKKIASKFDEDLFGFFVQTRDEAAVHSTSASQRKPSSELTPCPLICLSSFGRAAVCQVPQPWPCASWNWPRPRRPPQQTWQKR